MINEYMGNNISRDELYRNIYYLQTADIDFCKHASNKLYELACLLAARMEVTFDDGIDRGPAEFYMSDSSLRDWLRRTVSAYPYTSEETLSAELIDLYKKR